MSTLLLGFFFLCQLLALVGNLSLGKRITSLFFPRMYDPRTKIEAIQNNIRGLHKK